MSERSKIEYSEISNDWRHRDNLTWQIPSLLSAIAGGLVAAAYTVNIPADYERAIRLMLLGFAAGLSVCLTFALGQNLLYQLGSGKALERLRVGGEIPEGKFPRGLWPKDLGLSWKDVLKRLFGRLLGSTMLLILCLSITGCVIWLFFRELL